MADGVNAVDLEDRFGEINTDCGNVHGGRFLHGGCFNNDHYGASTPDTGAVHTISLRATRLRLAQVWQGSGPLSEEGFPLRQGGGALVFEVFAGSESTVFVEMVVEGGVDGGEFLQTLHLPETEHRALSPS